MVATDAGLATVPIFTTDAAPPPPPRPEQPAGPGSPP